jgi:hypothetical protein
MSALVQPSDTPSQPAPLATCPLVDPRLILENRHRFRRDLIPELELANSLYVPSGQWAARGWVLVRRGDYDDLDPYATNLQLTLLDTVNPPLTFKNLTVVQARCVSRGVAADPDAVYLVELTDGRGVLHNPWFAFPTNSAYNVRAPAYPGLFYEASLNTGTTWAWTQVIEDLWNQMSEFLGNFPGMPVSPPAVPENYWYPGCTAFHALCEILDLFGLTIAVDLTQDAAYTIVVLGATDPNTALQTKYKGLLEDDLEWIDTGSGRVPGSVTVYFHRRNEYYGTEETVRRDTLQWATKSLYSVTVNAPAQFSEAVGQHFLWDDFTVRYDINDNPMSADTVTANTIANATVQDYYNRIYRGTQGYLWQLYAGVLPFTTGPMIDGVRWRQVFVEDESDTRRPQPLTYRDRLVRAGWRTEIVRGPQPPWPQVERPHPLE